MNEEKLVSGRYRVNRKTAHRLSLYARILNMRITDLSARILEDYMKDALPDDVFKKIEDKYK